MIREGLQDFCPLGYMSYSISYSLCIDHGAMMRLKIMKYCHFLISSQQKDQELNILKSHSFNSKRICSALLYFGQHYCTWHIKFKCLFPKKARLPLWLAALRCSHQGWQHWWWTPPRLGTSVVCPLGYSSRSCQEFYLRHTVLRRLAALLLSYKTEPISIRFICPFI